MYMSTRPCLSLLSFFPGQPAPRLYDRVVEVLRVRYYSHCTEEACIHWVRRFASFHAGEHPRELGERHGDSFLTHLAVKESVATSTHSRALAGLLFLHQCVLQQPLNRIEGFVRARKPTRIPVVLSCDQVQAVLDRSDGVAGLVRTLPYGSELRLLQSLRAEPVARPAVLPGRNPCWDDPGVVAGGSRREHNSRKPAGVRRGSPHDRWHAPEKLGVVGVRSAQILVSAVVPCLSEAKNGKGLTRGCA